MASSIVAGSGVGRSAGGGSSSSSRSLSQVGYVTAAAEDAMLQHLIAATLTMAADTLTLGAEPCGLP